MQEKKKFNYGIVILGLICLGIFMPDYAQYQVPAFGSQLMESLGLSSSQFSSIATAPLIPGIVLSVFAGMLVDKFGTRKTLITSVGLSLIAVVLRVFSTTYLTMYISMIFIGICATFFSSNCAKIMGMWFSPEKASITMGVYLAFANGGMALGIGTASLYPSMKAAFIGAAVIGMITFIAWVFLMREKEQPKVEGATEDKVSIKEGAKVSFKSKGVWLAATCLFLTLGSMTSFSNFMPTALASRGMAESTASVVAMSITLGALLGSFISPLIAARMGKVKTLMLIYAVITALGMVFAWRITTNPVLLFILLFIVGFFGNGFAPILLALPVSLPGIGTKYGGTACGLLTTIQLAGSVIIPTYIIAPIVGTNYTLMFILFACMSLAFCVVSRFLPIDNK